MTRVPCLTARIGSRLALRSEANVSCAMGDKKAEVVRGAMLVAPILRADFPGKVQPLPIIRNPKQQAAHTDPA
jgi:hypothetical protein